MKTKNRWAVVVGQPTKMNKVVGKDPSDYFRSEVIGKWYRIWDYDGCEDRPKLFSTRAEARLYAKEIEQQNNYWKFHAKKYNG
jgi:hypothetical protein